MSMSNILKHQNLKMFYFDHKLKNVNTVWKNISLKERC